MKKQIKRIISYLILGLFTICTYLLIINISSKDLVKSGYLEKELANITITDIINSPVFDNDNDIQKIRKNINSIYSVADILNIPADKITEIINSKISTDIITKIVINITDTIVTGDKKELFNLTDYNQIVDNNIDLITNEINLNLSYEEKIILTKILKEVGEKTIKEVPSTDLVLDKIDSNKLNIIRIIISKHIRYILVVFDIILLSILVFLNFNYNIIKYLLKSLFVLLIGLFVTSIFVHKSADIFNNEWLFIRRFIFYFNYNVIISMIYIAILIFILLFINCIIKRKAWFFVK